MIFETTSNLREDQICDITKSLNQILLEDFQVMVDSDKIVWFTDNEIVGGRK